MPQTQQILSPAQIAQLAPSQQAAYMASLTPQQRQQVQAAVQAQSMAQAKSNDNRLFMRKSIEKIAYCPVAGGSGTSAVYAPGATLVFDLPVIGGGYAVGLLITANLAPTFAAGTSAVQALTPSAPFSIFQELDINYNGAQIRTHPYIIKLLDITRGFMFSAQDFVLTGQGGAGSGDNSGFGANATITSNINSATMGVAAGLNTWGTQKFFLPFNAIARDSVPGVLPVMGVGNKPQLKLMCASAFVSEDPLLSPVYPVSGTGQAATFTASSTVNVDMVYLDGTNLTSPTPLSLDMQGEPTLQYYWDTPLNPLNANLLQRQHISTLLEHWFVFSIIIDAQQFSLFSATSNLTAFDLSPDSVGQINFFRYGLNTNVSVYDYWQRQRRTFGQDFDQGVMPWIVAPTRTVSDASNRNGVQSLNMRPGGYPATTHAYQVTAVSGATNIAGFSLPTPRVETFLISLNYDGLRIS